MGLKEKKVVIPDKKSIEIQCDPEPASQGESVKKDNPICNKGNEEAFFAKLLDVISKIPSEEEFDYGVLNTEYVSKEGSLKSKPDKNLQRNPHYEGLKLLKKGFHLLSIGLQEPENQKITEIQVEKIIDDNA